MRLLWACSCSSLGVIAELIQSVYHLQTCRYKVVSHIKWHDSTVKNSVSYREILDERVEKQFNFHFHLLLIIITNTNMKNKNETG